MLKERILATMSKKTPLIRTYSKSQYQQFRREFEKQYPDIYKAINDEVKCITPIIFAMYESGLFFIVLEKK